MTLTLKDSIGTPGTAESEFNFMAVARFARPLTLTFFHELWRFISFRSLVLYPLLSPSFHNTLSSLLPRPRPFWPRQLDHVTHRQMGT